MYMYMYIHVDQRYVYYKPDLCLNHLPLRSFVFQLFEVHLVVTLSAMLCASVRKLSCSWPDHLHLHFCSTILH